MASNTVFVSPDGSDTWSGALPERNSAGTDGPLQTLAAAQAWVRKTKAALAKPAELRVVLRGGRYELDEPWRFHSADSGFGRDDTIWPRQARTWPVTWAAYEDETPIISGGRRLAGPWQEGTHKGQRVWTTTLSGTAPFTQLWVDGKRRRRPRLPKQGVRQVAGAVNPDFSGHGHTDHATAFHFHPGELKADWHNLQDVELRFFGWWLDRTVKLRTVDEEACTATFDRDVRLRLEWGPGDGVDYFVENCFEALTEPGEWYFDIPTGALTYLPLPGEDLDTAEVVIAQRDHLLALDGAAHLRFEGLTFAHSEWTLPADISGTKQAAIHVPGALQIRRGDDIVFQGCTVEHVGTYGAEVLDESCEVTFNRCRLADLGGGGVRIWHGCRRNALLDCEIGDGGHRFACACGVIIGKSTGNRVEHCHIHDFTYTGISVGWNWGYAESDGYGNLIEWNHIHDIGKGLLSDMGGIYLLGHAAGTRLRYNHIHDITCRRYGGWCLYTDEGSSDVLVESNLCYRTNKTAYNQHYGRNNTIRNNILAYGGDAVLSYGRPEEHRGLIFEGNILLSHDTPILRGATPERWQPHQTRFHRNLYWCETGPVTFERGGASIYATQPFPEGFLAAAECLAPLGDVPQVEATPADEAGWSAGRPFDTFVSAQGTVPAPDGAVSVHLLRCGNCLLVHGRFSRPEGAGPIAHESIWNREHFEVFLRPAADAAVTVQLGVDPEGESLVLWHGVEAPAAYRIEAEARQEEGGWSCTVTIPLDPIAAAAGVTDAANWRGLFGVLVPAPVGDFAFWQDRGHDPAGVVADPGFGDAAAGDFHLAADAAARSIGFVPWDVDAAGPRDPADS